MITILPQNMTYQKISTLEKLLSDEKNALCPNTHQYCFRMPLTDTHQFNLGHKKNIDQSAWQFSQIVDTFITSDERY